VSRRFLVTGGCGFIGSHLTIALLARGDAVVVIDDLSSGVRTNLPVTDDRLDCIVARAQDVDLAGLGPFHGAFHLAAQASVPLSIEQFYDSSMTNLASTLRVMAHCSQAQVPLVYASSSAVYGNLPLGDEAGAIDLLSPYAADKFTSEVYAAMAQTLYGLRSYGLRFFNVYGPRQPPDSPYSGVIAIFVGRLLMGEALHINGGHQTRDFVFVADVVRGLLAAHAYLENRAVATCSNLLTGRSISIDQLADQLSAIVGVTPERVYRALPAGDPAASLGDRRLMDRQLELGAMTSLEDGLTATIDWMRRLHEG
jgi:UDP-glucose 4-epimerase